MAAMPEPTRAQEQRAEAIALAYGSCSAQLAPDGVYVVIAAEGQRGEAVWLFGPEGDLVGGGIAGTD